MKYMVSMNFLRSGSSAENKASKKELLDLYAKWKPPAGMTIHEFLSRCDGGGGFTVIETDDAADLIGVTANSAPSPTTDLPVIEVPTHAIGSGGVVVRRHLKPRYTEGVAPGGGPLQRPDDVDLDPHLHS